MKAKYRDCNLTAERLREVLNYDPETGIFRWRELRPATRIVKVGDIAGSLDRRAGYIRIGIDGYLIYAHCLAWLWMTGEWPRDQVDHCNTIRDDNRWSNLREATFALNSQNRHKACRNNGTGTLGVSMRKRRRKKYVSRITINRKTTILGYFLTASEAHDAYISAKRALHPGGTL